MKMFDKAKKLTTVLLSVLVISILFTLNGATTTVKAATNNPVQFYSSYQNHYYIGTYFTTYIKVNTLGSNQHVYIHAKTDTTTWGDIEGQYVTTLNDGSQIWRVSTSFIGSNIEYAIKYVVDGQTYWDNNNSSNYTEANILGSGVNIAVNQAFSGSTTASGYPIKVAVSNFSYDKTVIVRYTQDNWVTYTDKTLSYSNINLDGSEYWATTVDLNPNTTSNFHYAVGYVVNGVTYWDNNFGSNYNF